MHIKLLVSLAPNDLANGRKTLLHPAEGRAVERGLSIAKHHTARDMPPEHSAKLNSTSVGARADFTEIAFSTQ